VAFSPDASMLAFNSSEDKKVYLYGFDNATGQMSNPQEIPYSDNPDDIGRGLAFSFDSRFIYVTTSSDLYQIDLQDGNSVEHIAHHFGPDEDGWPVAMGNITLGPDCRMYISPGSTTYYLHVVHHPNEKGAACGFEARALRTASMVPVTAPLPSHTGTLPLPPMKRSCWTAAWRCSPTPAWTTSRWHFPKKRRGKAVCCFLTSLAAGASSALCPPSTMFSM
jgi:hypothetical protein